MAKEDLVESERDPRFFALERAAVNTIVHECGRLEHRVSSPAFMCTILRDREGLLSVNFIDRATGKTFDMKPTLKVE